MTDQAKTTMPATRPALRMVGRDGNAFLILGRAQRVARLSGWTPEEIEAFVVEAESSDYDHLLQTCMEWFDVDGGDYGDD